METKKTFSMDAMVDLSMTKLFLLAEYVWIRPRSLAVAKSCLGKRPTGPSGDHKPLSHSLPKTLCPLSVSRKKANLD